MIKEMFTRPQQVEAWRSFGVVLNRDRFWDDFRAEDWEAAVRFWCRDLVLKTSRLSALKEDERPLLLHEVLTSSGRRVAFGVSLAGTWRMALTMIFYHLKTKREEARHG